MYSPHEHPQLGSGTFGIVYRALQRGQLVAIKKPTNHSNVISVFKNEIAIHRQLSHPNIVAYLGELSEPESCGFVLELIPGGSLYERLVSGPIPPDLQYSFCLDIARGLGYLHDMRMIHRDLKPENILLEWRDQQVIAKISDFGHATSLDGTQFSRLVGTIGFIAPELCMGNMPYPYSLSTDIYAYSIVMWMLIVRRPFFYSNEQDKPTVYQRVADGERESFPDGVVHDYKALITDCWAQCPESRPQISDIMNRLSTIQSSQASVDRLDAITEDKYGDLFQSLDQLSHYGESLLPKRPIAGQKTIMLAEDLRAVVTKLSIGSLTVLQASQKISTLIEQGKKTMSQDRQWKDILTHFILACTGIGLIVMLVHKLSCGQFFLNQTTRQKKLDAVNEAVGLTL